MRRAADLTDISQSAHKIHLIVWPQWKRWKQMFYRLGPSTLVRMRAVKVQKNVD